MLAKKISLILLFIIIEESSVCGYLYLTESAQTGHLILNWKFSTLNPPDMVALLYHDPDSCENIIYLTNVSVNGSLQGWYETNYSLNQDLPGNWSSSDKDFTSLQQCYPYYIASLLNSTIIETNCFKIQPSWMKNFSDLRIGEMMIPGTHDSGAFESPLIPLISKWALAQNRNFWQQLVHGIRFFDIRAEQHGDGAEGIYSNHGIVSCTPLLPQLQYVKKFLELSPYEIVILDFHEITAAEDEIDDFHQVIIETLQDLFGDQIYPFTNVSNTYGPKLSELQESNRRIIVGYSDKKIIKNNSWLWPDMKRYWANTNDLNELEEYIINVLEETPKGNPLSSIMAELTPPAVYIMEHILDKDLKYLADQVNRNLDNLIRDNNPNNSINIIATDYFTGNDMINLALESNLKKLKQKNRVTTTNKLS